jgi:hypothetical protein
MAKSSSKKLVNCGKMELAEKSTAIFVLEYPLEIEKSIIE